MAATPEILRPEAPQISERQEEFVVPETLQQSGIKVVQKTFKAQVSDDNGAPMIQAPPAQVITVQPPSDQATLNKQAKGSVSSSLTWLAAFWLRIIKKATYFGWRVVSAEQAPAVKK
jgi:hypothetical protein